MPAGIGAAIDVTVETAAGDGTAQTSAASTQKFSYGAPTIAADGLSIQTDATAGGATNLVVTGTNFGTAGASVKIGASLKT